MKKLFTILTVLLTMMISSTSFAAHGDMVQLVDMSASNFVSKLNSNNINISVSEPIYSSNEGPYNTAVYTSDIYNSSSYFGEITFFVNGTGYISAMIVDINTKNKNEVEKSSDLMTQILSVVGLNSMERSLAFDIAQRNNGKGGSLCSATFRFVNTTFEFKTNNVWTLLTAHEL